MRQLQILRIVVLVWMLILGTATVHGYSGGSGTRGDPYQIATTADLQSLASSPNIRFHLRLTSDLDMTGVIITPIGTVANPFPGTFDGDGHTISNLTINLPTTDIVGLFGCVGSLDDRNAAIYDLRLINASITGEGFSVGLLAGRNIHGTISNCYATGAVSGIRHVGGLVGFSKFGTVSNCYADSTVTGTGFYVGGLMGYNDFGTISNCYAAGAVSGNRHVGGLVGYNYVGTISNCYADSTVSGTSREVGGLVGRNNWKISNCYASP